jgi:phosphoglycolate phosphatase-like HAD superfamily hydrolase
MGASPSRPTVTVLVTDMDNTLFDWLGMWQAAFGAMLERLTADSGMARETLEREFYALHQRYGTTEYAFAIQELPSLRARHPPEDLPARYAPAIEAYRTVRRQTLRLYSGVLDTLRTIRAAGTLVVAYTESRAYYADYRVRTLGLDRVLDYLYSPPDHALPEGVTPSLIRRYPPEHYRLHGTVHRHTPEGVWKPAAAVLLGILRDVGAEPGEAAYVGDSLIKDVAMAQAARVMDVFARYGDVRNRPGYALLRRVTHWSPTVLAGSERLTEADVLPTHVLTDGFAELPRLIAFHRFMPRRPPASPAV